MDIKNQHNILGNINSPGTTGGMGDGGDGGMQIDYFDLIYERLLKEIDQMMQSA